MNALENQPSSISNEAISSQSLIGLVLFRSNEVSLIRFYFQFVDSGAKFGDRVSIGRYTKGHSFFSVWNRKIDTQYRCLRHYCRWRRRRRPCRSAARRRILSPASASRRRLAAPPKDVPINTIVLCLFRFPLKKITSSWFKNNYHTFSEPLATLIWLSSFPFTNFIGYILMNDYLFLYLFVSLLFVYNIIILMYAHISNSLFFYNYAYV